ncbi:hypothetical protein FRC05_004522 [Tulasnella sp. 425]|nr:hypothetical protein FRC05_004522 [Tulasnella sp. 425]
MPTIPLLAVQILRILSSLISSLFHLCIKTYRKGPTLTRVIISTIIFVVVLRLEWAFFRPRIVLFFKTGKAPDDRTLPFRVKAAEEVYQKVLRQRQELIHRTGPARSEIAAWPRDLSLYTLWDFFPAAFNCPHTVERIGNPGVGGKWVCGLDRLVDKKDCIVYSFGSPWDSSFEAAVLHRTKYCKIYGHHFDTNSFGPEVRSIDRLKWRSEFKKCGLYSKDQPPLYRTLSSLMHERGHDFVDLVKIDLEGWEFAALVPLFDAYRELPLPFGQLQLEIHANDMPLDKVLEWWELLEASGLRPFHAEPNLVYANINRGSLPTIADERQAKNGRRNERQDCTLDVDRGAVAGHEGFPGSRSLGIELAEQSASEPPAYHMSSALPRMSDSESGKFIAAVGRHAHSEGKHQDNEWQADFAASCFQASGNVMRWYRLLDEDVQTDWDKLSKALVERFGDANGSGDSARAEADDTPVEESLKDKENERRDEDQYTPDSEKSESELFDTSDSAQHSPASTGYITPLPTPPISRTGRIKMVDDDEPTAKPRWVSKRRNGNGAHTACDHAMDAMVVSYSSRCGSKERHGVQSRADPECEDAWLGATWPGRHSDDWTLNPTLVAAFATVTHDKTGTKWVSSSNRDEGATEHVIWKVSEDDTMEIEYLEDNGSQSSFSLPFVGAGRIN